MSGNDSEDECDVLEESPCGRWLKRKEEVEQHDVPGIDATYLAMDTEEGVEVVWNEVRFSERKYFTAREEKISEVFERLIQLDHPNIVKLHKYWMDKDVEHPRVIFITEYMSSGSLKQFLKKTKRNVIRMALPSWIRWCSQILSALYYLHSNHPSIVHGNLNCDTIFMSHNGLIKIGWVGGTGNDILRQVKTIRDDKSNAHYVAPEAIMNANRHINGSGQASPSTSPVNDDPGTTTTSCERLTNISEEKIGNGDKSDCVITTAADIYSFGICALEMAVLEINSSLHGLSSTTNLATATASNSTTNSASTTNSGSTGSNDGHATQSVQQAAQTTQNNSNNSNAKSQQQLRQQDSFDSTLENAPTPVQVEQSQVQAQASISQSKNKQSTSLINSEMINRAIDSLENPLQKDFIRKCIQSSPQKRPTARDLIFHPIIFEVPSLRLIAAHKIVNTSTPYQPEQLTEDALFRSSSKRDKDTVLVEIKHNDGRENVTITQGDTPRRELDKFLEEVRNGVYPLTQIFMANGTTCSCCSGQGRRNCQANRHIHNHRSPSCGNANREAQQSQTPEHTHYDREMRRIVDMMCNIKPHQKNTKIIDLTLLLRMDDKMNRQLSCEMSTDDPAISLSNELVFYGLINEEDRDMVQRLIEDTINRGLLPDSSLSVSVSVSQSQEQIAAQN